jgi:hypothetical protein
MGRVGDPISEMLIHIVIDSDRVWSFWSKLDRGDDTAFDPVMDDPKADAVSLADLTNVQGSIGRSGS